MNDLKALSLQVTFGKAAIQAASYELGNTAVINL